MADEDPRIAAFARTNRRRTALAFAALGLVVLIAGAVLLVVMLSQSHDVLANDAGTRKGGGYQLIVVAGGMIVVGVFTLGSALRASKTNVDR